jgi:protein-tyrosine-phosphatase
MAAALFKQAANQHPLLGGVEAESAGLEANDGDPAEDDAKAVMLDHALDVSNHTARRLDAAMISRADLVLAMTSSQRREIEERFAIAVGKTFALGEYVGTDISIADPIHKGRQVYKRCAEQLDELVRAAADRLASGDRT